MRTRTLRPNRLDQIARNPSSRRRQKGYLILLKVKENEFLNKYMLNMLGPKAINVQRTSDTVHLYFLL